jgi:hypothetical protein
MIKSALIKRISKRTALAGLAGLLMLLLSFPGQAQEHPPKPIKVTTFQNLCFGAFFQSLAGGSVIIYPNGTRSVTGDVIQASLGFSYYPAIFEVEANPGALIVIQKGPDVSLMGSNGGSMTLHLGDTDPASPFINTLAPPGKTQVRVGATLLVGSPLANPVGSYSGSFYITFIQQ